MAIIRYTKIPGIGNINPYLTLGIKKGASYRKLRINFVKNY